MPLSQLASTSGIISTSASLTPNWLAVSAVPSPLAVAIFEQPQKWKRVTDPAEQALTWDKFQDWWASGHSSPSTGNSSAARPPQVTPPVDPGSSSTLALPPVTAVSTLSRASPQHSRQSPGSRPVLPDTANPSNVRTGVALSAVTEHPHPSSV